MQRVLHGILLVLFGLVRMTTAAEPTLQVQPNRLQFDTPESSAQLLVTLRSSGVAQHDLTHGVAYLSENAAIATVSSTGRVHPVADGHTVIRIQHGDHTEHVPVVVSGLKTPTAISFRREVLPILSKAGCNAGGCHGKAEGQNGFRLSIFGYDAEFDHHAIVLESRGRRVSRTAPEQSLLLLKATATLPHGGGQKFTADSRWHRRLLRWIAEGARIDDSATGPPQQLIVTPTEVTLPAGGTQQLRITMRDADGRERCVTAEAEYQSNQETIAGVDREGLIAATTAPGEAAILVRYLGHIGVCRVTRPREAVDFTRPPTVNFIDTLVWNKLEKLRIQPADLCDDATFQRRVFLDVIGTLPTAAETREFLSDNTPGKREQLVRKLLDRPEYADYWTQKWSDLLQIDKDIIEPQGAVAMTRWVHRQFRQNTPFDEFARQVITARGHTWQESPAGFFQVQKDPEQLARSVSQLFLGVRIECAQCHHHPFERWEQQDYFALAGFFTGVQRKKAAGGGMKISFVAGKDLPHPRTAELVPTAALAATPSPFLEGIDRRKEFALWMTAADNPYFAKTLANRLWAHYFGRGLVEPIDDLRASNPASNEPLLQALADHLRDVNYDLKRFTQTLLNSRVYQLSAAVNASNRLDEQSFSHAAWKPLPAEVLLDAISQATDVPEEFNGWPRGYRAIQIWDNKLPSHFLEVFGRPTRQTVCACERESEPGMAQALVLMNADTTSKKVQHRHGRAAALAASTRTNNEIIEELYLTTLSRFPTPAEHKLMAQVFSETDNRRAAVEDILWTLLNTKEFVFNH